MHALRITEGTDDELVHELLGRQVLELHAIANRINRSGPGYS